MEHKNWNGFAHGAWQDEINVRDFIQTNYKEYKGNADFLAGATPRTQGLMKKLQAIPAAWEVSLRLAEEHGDTEKAHIERIKLATSAEIMQEVPHD